MRGNRGIPGYYCLDSTTNRLEVVGLEARGNLKPVERAKAVRQGQSAKRVAPVHEPIIKEPREPVVTASYAWCDGLLSPPFI